MGEATTIFSIHDRKDYEIHEIVQQVYDALKEKGYNPVNQLVGYILSEDPTYITTYKNARALIRKVDRDDLLQAMLRNYLNVRRFRLFQLRCPYKGGGVLCLLVDVGGRGSFLRKQPGTRVPPQRCAPGPHLQDVRRRNSPACPSRAKAQSMGRVKIWFTSTSYSQGSRALRSCFSSFSDPAKRWMR